RDLDLGVVERDGDDFRVKVTATPAPNRTPADAVELPKLSPLEYQQVTVLSKDKFKVGDAIKILKERSPREEQRGAVRQFLKLHVHDPFHGNDAIEALGAWGTPDDVPFLIALDKTFVTEHVIVALGKMRDAAAAPFLVKKLGEFVVGEKAEAALRWIGPA